MRTTGPTFERECVTKGGESGAARATEGKRPGVHGKGQGNPKGAVPQSWNINNPRKGPTFRFQGTCNMCGGWGHCQAEWPWVTRAYAADQIEDTADFEAWPSAPGAVGYKNRYVALARVESGDGFPNPERPPRARAGLSCAGREGCCEGGRRGGGDAARHRSAYPCPTRNREPPRPDSAALSVASWQGCGEGGRVAGEGAESSASPPHEGSLESGARSIGAGRAPSRLLADVA